MMVGNDSHDFQVKPKPTTLELVFIGNVKKCVFNMAGRRRGKTNHARMHLYNSKQDSS
jgi:hypothetical protein